MKHPPPNIRVNGDDALVAPPAVNALPFNAPDTKWADAMTMLTPGMLRDRQTTTTTANRTGVFRRLRSSLTDGRRPIRRSAAGRPSAALLRDVALGGTAAIGALACLGVLLRKRAEDGDDGAAVRAARVALRMLFEVVARVVLEDEEAVRDDVGGGQFGEARHGLQFVRRVGQDEVEGRTAVAFEVSDGVAPEEGALIFHTEGRGVLARVAEHATLLLDEDRRGGTAAYGLEAEGTRAREQVEHDGAV